MLSSLLPSNAGSQDPVGANTRKEVLDLKELFPEFTIDDLVSILFEYNDDFDRAVNAISEGRVEQWGSVMRKKDKRAPNGVAHGSNHPKESIRVSDREKVSRTSRGDGRGSAPRGRGNRRGGRRAVSFSVPARGASSSTQQGPSIIAEDFTPSEWGPDNMPTSDAGLHPNEPSKAPAGVPVVELDSVSSGEVESAVASQLSKDAAPPQDTKLQSSSVSVPVAHAVPKPATPMLSWAQIAKLQEKKVIAPPITSVTAPVPVPTDVPLSPASPVARTSVPAIASTGESISSNVESETQTQAVTHEWEEPTTAQAPSWDDEPQPQTAVSSSADSWITSSTDVAKTESVEAIVEELTPPSQAKLEPLAVGSAFPAQLGLQKVEVSVPVVKPGFPAGYARSVNSRAGHRFKTDQAVIMPSTFGSIEKLGMQFGSVSLGSDDMDSNASEPPVSDASVSAPSAPEATREAPPPQPAAPETTVPASSQTTTHAQPSSITSTQGIFQQTLPSSQSQLPTQPRSVLQPPQTISTSPSQTVAQSSSETPSTTTSVPLLSFSTQPTTSQTPAQRSTPPYPSQPQLAQSRASAQPAAQQSQQFSLFPSHLESTATQHNSSHTSQQPQQSSSLQHNSYFRQPEQTYFNTPTPPVGQSQQDYGSFTPLSQQLGHQTQTSHLSGFGSDHYGYNDASRGFYDTYNQLSYSGRSGIGHEDVGKALSSAQPSQASTVLPQSTNQLSQQPSSQPPQSAAQSQPATQQGYPQTVPHYFYNPYAHPQPPVYPYSNYGLNQYGNRYLSQQPAQMFQTPNPPSGTPSGAKVPSGAQSQNPYVQGAPYQYEEYQHHQNPEFGNKLYGAQTFISGTSPAGSQLRGVPTGSSSGDTFSRYGGPVSKEGGGASLPGGRSNVPSYYSGNNNRLPPTAGGAQSQLGQTQNQTYAPPPIVNESNLYYARQGYWQ